MGTTHLFVNPVKTYPGVLPDQQSRKRARSKPARRDRKYKDTLTVGGLLESIQPVPERSLLLGKCADGLPFLIETGDPELGAILIGCESGSGKTHQLQVMVDSALRTCSPHACQVAILTLNPEEWSGLTLNPTRQKYVQGCYVWYDPRAVDLIEHLIELAEARRAGARQGAGLLFILDDLTAVEDLPLEAQVNLRWLLEYGPQSDIWVVGTLDARQTADFRYWVDTFRTRIVGRVASREMAEVLAARTDVPEAALEPGAFRVWTGEAWLTYRLPLLGDLRSLEG